MTTHNRSRRRSAPRGFTILELLAVIAIIAILGTIVTYNLVGAQDKVRKTQTIANMKTIGGALGIYRGSYGVYPQNLQVLVAENLMKAIPMDGWGRQYGFYSPAQYNGQTLEFLIVSSGPNETDTADDLVRLSTDPD